MERKQSRKGGKKRQRGENWGFTRDLGGGDYKANMGKGRMKKEIGSKCWGGGGGVGMGGKYKI